MTDPVPTHRPLVGRAILAFTLTAAGVLAVGGAADAAIVPTVSLATSADYAVLGATTVTNTGGSVLNGSLGLSPGGAISGFPPGLVVPPGTTDTTNPAAAQAQSDLTAAYVDAAGRPITATTTADLANLNLQAGIYAGPAKSALALTGPLVLDGAGDATSVFIFQTDSALITGTGSTVSLVNGAQECNVFWQVGSSATLGSGSVFAGNILALTSITVNAGVTVHGRALARNGAVTLNNDTFAKPTCASQSSVTTTTVGPGGTTTTSAATTATTTALPGDEARSAVTGSGGSALPSATTGPGGSGSPSATTGSGGSGSPSAATGSGSSGAPSATTGDGSLNATPAGGTATGISRRLTETGLTSQAAGSPDVPRVVGPPRTGAAPIEGRSTRWLPAILSGLVTGAMTLALRRRRSLPRSRAESAQY